MAVLIRHRADALTQEVYDQVSPRLIESVKTAPGFIMHASYEDANGFCVSEIWETREQHDTWFNATVVPNLPMTVNQEEVELHSFHKP